MKIGVLLYTYNRTDDARINMEIIRNVWSRCDLLKDVVIVHSFNGKKDWWSGKYLENELLYLENPGHFAGAEVLINEGVKCFAEKYQDIDYVILLASDTWLVKPEYLEEVINMMKKEDRYLAAAVWGTKKMTDIWKRGSALDFNIFNLKWAVNFGLFPIRYSEFKEKFEELFFYKNETIYPEPVLMIRFLQAIAKSIEIPSENLLRKIAEEHVYRMKEREPVHKDGSENTLFKRGYFTRRMYWADIGLITHHEPVEKKKVLSKWNVKLGEYGQRFLASEDLAYYNRGLGKTTYTKGSKKINYGD